MTLYDLYIDFFYYHPLSTMVLWGVYAVIAWAMLARLLCRHKLLWTRVNRVGWIAVTLMILWGTVLNPAFPQHSTMKSWHRCRKLVDFL